MEIKQCKLNEKSQCTAYLEPCSNINDCALKLFVRKGSSLEEIDYFNLFLTEIKKI